MSGFVHKIFSPQYGSGWRQMGRSLLNVSFCCPSDVCRAGGDGWRGGSGRVAAADLALGRRHQGLLPDGTHRGEFRKAGSRAEVVWSPSGPCGSPKPSPTQLFFFFFLASASLLLPMLE